jgi:hypothetical protein
VNATVAERSRRARTIRNQGPRDGRYRPPQPSPRTSGHLRLVADHGRMVDPDFSPGRPVWVSGMGVSSTGASGTGLSSTAVPAHAGAQAGRVRMRLTRRGRLVFTTAVVLLIAVASMVLASAVQAAAHP